MPREPRCACKEMGARREAPGVVSTTRKTRNDTDIPSRRNPMGPPFHSIPSLISAAARWDAQTAVELRSQLISAVLVVGNYSHRPQIAVQPDWYY